MTIHFNLIHIKLLAFLCLSPLLVNAQAEAVFEKVKADHPDDYLVVSKLKTTYEFFLKEDKPYVKTSRYVEYLYMSEKAVASNSHSFHYSPTFEEDLKYKAFVYYPNEKGKLKKEEVKKYSTSSSVGSGIFYDDQKERVFIYPNVKKGSFTSIYHESVLNEPRLLPAYYFQRGVTVLSSEFVVTVPDNFKVRNVIYGDSTGIICTKEIKKGKTIYTWNASELKAIADENSSPNYSYYATHVICIPESYTDKKGEKVNILSNTADLYKWYSGFVQNINKEPSENLSNLVDSIIKGHTDTLEKAKAIYSWVQANMKYVAFEDGMGGFIPREASQIFNRRYGDCKDMSSILYVMLRKAGIKACYTWIGTRNIPYSYFDIPSPLCDNHMISAFYCKNKWWFLDGTTNYLAFGYPSGFIQGKEALIGIDKDSFEIVKVPVVENKNNCMVDSMDIYIENSTIKGTSNSRYTGYYKEDYVHSLARQKNLKDFNALSGLFEIGNNKFVLTNADIKGMENNNSDLVIKYSFEIPNYTKSVDNDLYVNLNLDKYLNNEFLYPDKRKTDWEVNYKSVISQHIVLHVPDGYTIVKLPKNNGFTEDSFGFNITYTQQKNVIVLDRTINLNTLMVTKNNFEKWNGMIDKLNAAYKDVITLQKSSH